MENFGLVTYREEYLLHNPKIDTTKQKENVLTIVSHEFAVSQFTIITIKAACYLISYCLYSICILVSLKSVRGVK